MNIFQKKFYCPFGECKKEYRTQNGLLAHQKRMGHYDKVLPYVDPEGFDLDQLAKAIGESLDINQNRSVEQPTLEENVEEGKECIICLSDKPTMAFIDCGHMITCLKCSQLVRKKNKACPMCRKPIKGLLKVYQ